MKHKIMNIANISSKISLEDSGEFEYKNKVYTDCVYGILYIAQCTTFITYVHSYIHGPKCVQCARLDKKKSLEKSLYPSNLQQKNMSRIGIFN